jgi:uncharacterized membrane protein
MYIYYIWIYMYVGMNGQYVCIYVCMYSYVCMYVCMYVTSLATTQIHYSTFPSSTNRKKYLSLRRPQMLAPLLLPIAVIATSILGPDTDFADP